MRFDPIARRYDLANRVLSLGQDRRWRATALTLMTTRQGQVLDAACGTHDFGIAALQSGVAAQVTGLDLSPGMLTAGEVKRSAWAGRLRAVQGNLLHPSPALGSFDAVLIAFGWRNLPDPGQGLEALSRLLRPGGELLVLDFFRPTRVWPRLAYRAIAPWSMPLVGALIADRASAYRHLADSIRGFLTPRQAAGLMAAQGWREQRWLTLAGGLVHAVRARRTPATPPHIPRIAPEAMDLASAAGVPA